MVLWLVFALMMGAAILAVLWPLSRPLSVDGPSTGEKSFVKDQIREIERDVARGFLSPAERDVAIAEVGRRFLRTVSDEPAKSPAQGEPALRRRRAASAVALSMIPLVSLAFYGLRGSPHLPAAPFSERFLDTAEIDLQQAVRRVEAHLANAPEDGRGWTILAPIYMRMGRPDDAVRAYTASLRLEGDNAARRADLAEAQVLSSGGLVTAEALENFRAALKLDAKLPKARYYIALAAEQDGRVEEALSLFKGLRGDAGPDAPWVPTVETHIAKLERNAPAEAIARLPDAERDEAIKGMVAGLAARLEADGGNIEDWVRLVRSHIVLGARAEALAALLKARERFKSDEAALAKLAPLGDVLQSPAADQSP
ncbi:MULTISPECIES: c-type cytochrome biogenesis protein CcmI [unclassified Chelatococcus]|uniref:c-type cytochrome biogenesis protein CcmI n=1 Tax=unclassified Chelatococcus TaxID=2638111 RepID=UPI001BCDA393|nr:MULTISPECIES: c-type cytochrome biogenesis protein CcmI [unclassified Chelatococcus]MBS7698477.1 c-type cytochrome biogenesis protein CcmI [Chelatococcus sp. YT9]MBX3559445.1 c-type cytochrome biogenesis protein CcmI [Chelatococcus sp.]